MRNAWIAGVAFVPNTYRKWLFPLSATSFTPPLITALAPLASMRLIYPSGAMAKPETEPLPLAVKPKRRSLVTTAQQGAPWWVSTAPLTTWRSPPRPRM